jgi:hypothetical protein
LYTLPSDISVQYVDGVALVNHDETYDHNTTYFTPVVCTAPPAFTGSARVPTPRIWTRRSREFGIPDTEHYYAGIRHDKAGAHASRRNRGRKPRRVR